jgi:hypothetical protein
MQDESPLMLRQHDQLRTDIANVERGLEVVMAQLARAPTRSDLAKTALGVILSTEALVVLWAEMFWRL